MKLDSIVTSVIKQIEERSIQGKEKYGTDLDREDLALIDWIEHAKQEHMDAILYLEKLKKEWTVFIDDLKHQILVKNYERQNNCL